MLLTVITILAVTFVIYYYHYESCKTNAFDAGLLVIQ